LTSSKYDSGKPRYDLIPPEALEELAYLYGQGCEKYGPRDWERGMSWTRWFAALMRHAWKWMCREERDPETGVHHMIAVAWNAFAIYTYSKRNIGTDDRPRIKREASETPTA